MTNIELAQKALAVWEDRDNWTYVQGGLGETADSTRIKNLYTYYRKVGKNSMTLDYPQWLAQYGLNQGKGKKCTDCSNFIQYLLNTGINRGTYFYGNMQACPDRDTAPVGTVLYMNGHVGIVVVQGVKNPDGSFKVYPESVDFYKYNNTCRKGDYRGSAFEKAVYLPGIDYSNATPRTMTAKVITDNLTVGDVLTAKDFEIDVVMSDGRLVKNPANWSASPLRINDLTNNITVKYKNLVSNITVKAKYRNPFTDVKETDWFYDDVMYLYEKNVMRGYDSDTFGVDGKMTRGMLLTVLYRLEGHPNVDEVMPFTDVPPEKYYTTPIAWGKQNGIIVGYQDGTFKPSNNITREDFVVVLYNYAKFKGYNVKAKSLDSYKAAADWAEVSNYAIEEVNWGYENGLIGYKSDLKPKAEITRQEAAAIVARFLRLVA